MGEDLSVGNALLLQKGFAKVYLEWSSTIAKRNLCPLCGKLDSCPLAQHEVQVESIMVLDLNLSYLIG